MSIWIRGAQPPADGGRHIYDIVAPQPGETLSLVVLSTHVLGVEVVWITDPVTLRQSCTPYYAWAPWPPADKKPRRQHLYFAAVLNRPKKARQILRMGPDSAVDLVRLARPGQGVRGLALQVKRAGGRAGLRLAYTADRDFAGPVPEAHPMAASLAVVMGGYTVDEAGLVSPSELLEGENVPLPPEGGA